MRFIFLIHIILFNLLSFSQNDDFRGRIRVKKRTPSLMFCGHELPEGDSTIYTLTMPICRSLNVLNDGFTILAFDFSGVEDGKLRLVKYAGTSYLKKKDLNRFMSKKSGYVYFENIVLWDSKKRETVVVPKIRYAWSTG